MKVTINDILNAVPVMRELADTSMKIKTAYKVSKIMSAIDKEYQLFQEARTKLIEKYGDRDENHELKIDDNGNYSIPPENISNFNEELNEILVETVELNVNPLSIDELDNNDFTPNKMINLMPFMSEE